MSYFNLRKREPEPETDDVEEEPDETEEEDPSAAEPTTWPAAIACGLRGPWRWLAGHFGEYGVTIAWVAHVGSLWAFCYYRGVVAAGLTAAWLGAFAMFVPREFLERLADAVERRATPLPKPTVSAAPGGEREAVRRLLLDLIGEARGVHLKTVLAHLQKHGQWEGRKVADLRVHLEALGIRVEPKVKVAGVPTRGVLRADLEALSPVEETAPSPTPSPPV